MAKWNDFKKNVDDVLKNRGRETKPWNLMAQATLTPILYVGVASWANLNSWPAWFVAMLATVGVGVATGMHGMCAGGIGLGVTHAILSNFKDELTRLFGHEPWNFIPRTLGDETVTAGPGGVLTLPDGSRVYPLAPQDRAGMSGFYPNMTQGSHPPPSPGVSGFYLPAATQMSDPVFTSSLNYDPLSVA